MRIRKKAWARPELESCDFFVKNLVQSEVMWKEKFKINRPIYLELGCGKGVFISKLASSNTGFNYIAVDIKDEMLVLAKRNIEKEYKEKNLPIENVLLIAADISRISNVFGEKGLVERIYINFCNPWPRAKHKKRRLTHPRQLVQYRGFLKDNKDIYFKTDDLDLFNESKKYFKDSNFNIIVETNDLESLSLENNIETEHEKMFKNMGKKINFLIARKIF